MGAHDDLFDPLIDLYLPLARGEITSNQPIQEWSEKLAHRCETDPSVLGAWAERMLQAPHGSLEASACTMLLHSMAFNRLGPWFLPRLPCSPAHPDEVRIREVCGLDTSLDTDHSWEHLCPPALADWLVIPPGTEFVSPEYVETAWWNDAKKRTLAIEKLVQERVPGWDGPELQRAWFRARLDGIRPSKSTDGENHRLAQALEGLLESLDEVGWQALQADPCFPRWRQAWANHPETTAVWRDTLARHSTEPPTPARRRVRYRA